MLTRLVDFIIGREPVVSAVTGLAGGVAALYAVLEAFDVLTLTPKQVAAIGALVAWAAAWLARRAVTPITSPAQRQLARMNIGPIQTTDPGGDS